MKVMTVDIGVLFGPAALFALELRGFAPGCIDGGMVQWRRDVEQRRCLTSYQCTWLLVTDTCPRLRITGTRPHKDVPQVLVGSPDIESTNPPLFTSLPPVEKTLAP